MIEVDQLVSSAFPGVKQVRPSFWAKRSDSDVSYLETHHDDISRFEERSYWFQHRNAVFSDFIKRFAFAAPFVDIGGGTGIVPEFLIRNGISALNVEPTTSGCKHSLKRHVPTLHCTIQESEVRDGSLPSAGMFDVLEHIEDDAETLRIIAAALAPGGYFLISVPAFGWLWSDEDVSAGHFRRYSRSTISRRLQDAGLEVVHSTYVFSFLVMPLFALRTVPSFLTPKSSAVRLIDHDSAHAPEGKLRDFINYLAQRERRALALGKQKSFGTTVLAVARKPL